MNTSESLSGLVVAHSDDGPVVLLLGQDAKESERRVAPALRMAVFRRMSLFCEHVDILDFPIQETPF